MSLRLKLWLNLCLKLYLNPFVSHKYLLILTIFLQRRPSLYLRPSAESMNKRRRYQTVEYFSRCNSINPWAVFLAMKMKNIWLKCITVVMLMMVIAVMKRIRGWRGKTRLSHWFLFTCLLFPSRREGIINKSVWFLTRSTSLGVELYNGFLSFLSGRLRRRCRDFTRTIRLYPFSTEWFRLINLKLDYRIII